MTEGDDMQTHSPGKAEWNEQTHHNEWIEGVMPDTKMLDSETPDTQTSEMRTRDARTTDARTTDVIPPPIASQSTTAFANSEDNADIDLATVLDAWQTATDRLQKTHELLRQEVGRLTDELEVKNRELERKDRLADLGRMAALVAHEVRNGMMPITLYMSLLRRRLEGDDATIDLIDKVRSGFTCLEVTVSDLLSFTSDREPDWAEIELNSFLQEVLESLRPQFDAQRVNADLQVPKSASIDGDHHMLRRLFLNLVINALDVMPTGGCLKIEYFEAAETNGCGGKIVVSDTGPGLSEVALEKLFDPFYTTKSGGTGLGLAIVERVMDAHHGSVRARNGSTGGAAIELTFPKPHREGSL